MRIVALALLLAVAHADEGDEAMGRRVQLLLRAHQADVFGCVGPEHVRGEALLHVVVGDVLAAKVEVLKADPGVDQAAACVAKRARAWDLSSLHASPGDQVVVPLAWRPEAIDASAVRATLRVEQLQAKQSTHLDPKLVHAVYVAGGRTNELRTGDLLYVDEMPADVSTARGATLVIVESPRTALPVPNRVVRRPAPYAIPGGTARLYLDGVGAPVAVDELCIGKGGHVPAHVHDASDELLYVEHGRAMTTLGPDTQRSGPGDILVIPRGTRHSIDVQEDFCAVQVYAPPGPEQRFKPTRKIGKP